MQFSNVLFAIVVGSALAMPDFQQANEPNKISAKVNIPFFHQIFLLGLLTPLKQHRDAVNGLTLVGSHTMLLVALIITVLGVPASQRRAVAAWRKEYVFYYMTYCSLH
jgi:hypothetical protein